MGRRTKYSHALSVVILELFSRGKTDKQVCEIIGISEKTLNNWKNKFPGFLPSVRAAKSITDEAMEMRLIQRGMGYDFTEEKLSWDKYGNELRGTVRRHVPPDVGAILNWLKNRQPEKWRDTKTLITNPGQIEATRIRSFQEFCEKSGYPNPFDKQLEWHDFAFVSQDQPRLILGARGYGKTDYITIMGVAYDIYLHGNDTSNLIVTKSKTRNSSIISEVADALEKNGVVLEKRNSEFIKLPGSIGKDYPCEVLTIKSSFRGRHPKRIIMDDPVTEEDTSEAMRLLVKKKYNEAYKLSKNIVIIGQPAHEDDLYGELRPILLKIETPHGSIPQLDADLEAMKAAGIDPVSIEMSYHLRIPKTGARPFDNIKYIDGFPTGDSSFAFIDPSFEGGDYTALTIIKAHFQGVAVIGFCWKKAWNHCLDEIAEKLKDNNVKQVTIETNSLGDMPVELLRTVLPQGIGVTGKKSNTNKHSRIMAAGSFAHLIWLSKDSDKIYSDQVVKYEYKVKHDDAPDSLASGLEMLGLIRGKM